MSRKILAILVISILTTTALVANAQVPFTKTPIDIEFGDSQPFDIAAGLIDGDDNIDLVADALDLTDTDDYLSWYVNIAPGYSEIVIDTLGSEAGHINVVDLDTDLDNDIVLCTASEVYWYANDGFGNFTQDLIDAVEASRLPIVRDLNDDTYQDIIALTPYEIFWAMNDGNEDFTHITIETIPIVDKALAVTDLDEDLDKDIVSSVYIDNDNHIVWYDNDGNETFSRTAIDTLTGLGDITDLVVDDLDEDGDQDLVFTLSSVNQIMWLDNDGNENFTRKLIASDFVQAPRRVVVVDLDNDLDKDLLVIGGNSAIGEVVYYENDGSESFIKRIIDNTAGNRWNLVVVDMENDGDMDIFVVSNYPHEISCYQNELVTTAVYETAPGRFALERIYPNPFNPHTTVTFSLSRPQHVNISVFDLTGRCIAMLVDQMFLAGTHDTEWNGLDLAERAVSSGVYLVRMETEEYVESRKTMLVR